MARTARPVTVPLFVNVRTSAKPFLINPLKLAQIAAAVNCETDALKFVIPANAGIQGR